jgi:adenylate kinase
MHLILLGAPGAGKGTQGAMLAERLGVPKVSTGDILRDAVREGTPLGLEAKRFMDAGELVPDEVILGLVRDALDGPDARDGAIFDGFPRNTAQAGSLSAILAERGRTLDAVVVIDVPEESLVRRLSGRRTDPVTGRVYHVDHNPAPPEIEARLVQRPDDREETVRNRLRVFQESTAPLVAHYESTGVPVHHAQGDRPIGRVEEEILGFLGR